MFIVFEGIDGSGKTTLSKMLLPWLEERGHEVVWFREPSDSEWGQKIRQLANQKDSIPIQEELQYFLRDRKWDVEHNISPALQSGKTVILDRYYLSTACYQGARGLDIAAIIKENQAFAPEADYTFLVDVEIETALSRIRSNRDFEAKLFEKEEFLTKVRSNYLKAHQADESGKIILIDGNPSLTEVFDQITSKLVKT